MPQLRIATSLPVVPDVAANIAHAQWAESEDMEIWLADGGGPDALTMAAVLAARTSRVRIGVAVTPVFVRTPAVLASTARVIAEVSAGRFVLGVGSSSRTIVDHWHGLPFEQPLKRVRETVELLRAMLAGEKTDFNGETLRSFGYRQPPCSQPVPIMLAALRGSMLALAGEIGDGVVLNLAPRTVLEDLVGTMRSGVPEDAHPLDREVVLRHHVLVTDDRAAGREAFRRRFTSYLGTGVYNRFLAWCGYGDLASELHGAWERGDRAATRRALSDEVIDAIAVIGDADSCRTAIRDSIDAGVHTHVLVPLGEDPDAVRTTLAALTPERLGL